MSIPETSTPETRRLSIPLPLWIGLSTILLFVAAVGLRTGARLYREQSSIKAAIAAQEAWARSLGKPGLVDQNSIEMEFVLIPPGQFKMGSPPSEKGREDDENQVAMTLTKGFYLGKTEVTQGQWRVVMGTTPWQGRDYVREGDNDPATYVSWDDAQAFCRKLSEKEDATYRLPTEAEWEYACRAGTMTPYSFGDDETKLSDYAWWGGLVGDGNAKNEEYAHEVGRKRPNLFGLHDMHGNVWEWCEDAYYVALRRTGTEPLGFVGGTDRVCRGGSWDFSAANCRSAARDAFSPSYRDFSLGFRVIRGPR